MPVPNQFIDGATCITTIVSTSVLDDALPIAWMLTTPNVEIVIPANTPVASVIPISLSKVQDYEISLVNGRPQKWQTQEWAIKMNDRSKESQRKNGIGEWTNFYRNATNHLGEKVGNHEVKKIIMKVNGKDE